MVTLAIALIATGLAVVGWFRPAPSPPPTTESFTREQTIEAEKDVCSAYQVAKNEVAINSNKPKPTGDDYLGTLATGTLARLAAYAAGDYMLSHLATEPATPTDLSNAVRSLGNLYKDLGIHALNDEPTSALGTILDGISSGINHVDELCK